MNLGISKQRIYASLLILGSSILLLLTISMLFNGALTMLVLWVSILLISELLIDLGCLLSSVRWWITNDKSKNRIPLRLGAAAAILHAGRVLIYVIGRVGPWIDFDIKPENRTQQFTEWSWVSVYFATIMSILGLIGVLIIWRLRRHAQKNK